MIKREQLGVTIDLGASNIGSEVAELFSGIKLCQMPDSDYEVPAIEWSRRCFEDKFARRNLKVAAAQLGDVLVVAVGDELINHSKILDFGYKTLRTDSAPEWEGGGYVFVNWESGDVQVAAKSTTLGPLPEKIIPVLKAVLTAAIDAYRQLDLPAVDIFGAHGPRKAAITTEPSGAEPAGS